MSLFSVCVNVFHLQYRFVYFVLVNHWITSLTIYPPPSSSSFFFSRYHYSYKIGYIPQVRYQNYFKPLRTVDSVALTPRDGKRGLINKIKSAPFCISHWIITILSFRAVEKVIAYWRVYYWSPHVLPSRRTPSCWGREAVCGFLLRDYQQLLFVHATIYSHWKPRVILCSFRPYCAYCVIFDKPISKAFKLSTIKVWMEKLFSNLLTCLLLCGW